MKQIMTFYLLFYFPTTLLYAQTSPTDRWKETERLNQKEKNVSFTDTLFLQKTGKDEMSLRKGSFLYKGKVDKKILDMGYMTYTILKNKDNEIRLQDDDFIHIFRKDAKDLSAIDASEKMADIALPSEPLKAIDRNMLVGNWEAYKRTGRKGPLPKIDYNLLLKTLSFETVSNKGYYGYLTTNFIGGTPLYSIKDVKGGHIVVEDKDKKEHLITVWKINKEELIMEDEKEIIYYMKRFQ